MYIYCVWSCLLCPLSDLSSKVSARFVVGRPWSPSSAPPSPGYFAPDYSLPGDSLMSTFIYSFMYSFIGKIFESLITTDLTDSSPPFIFTLFPKAFLSWTHFLVYISPLTFLLQISSVLHKIFSFYGEKKKDDLCFQRTLLYLFFTKASDSQRFHSN